MSKAIKINTGLQKGVNDLILHLFTSGKIKGAFGLTKVDGDKTGDARTYSLITDPAALSNADLLYPVMPRNAGALVSVLTQKGPAPGPVAVVIRPCELRALTELVKRNRANLDDLLLISSTCSGVFPTEHTINGEIKKELQGYWDTVSKGGISQGLRNTCKWCEEFVPFNADITISIAGEEDIDKSTRFIINSEKGEEFIKGFGENAADAELPKAVEELKNKRAEEKTKGFQEMNIGGSNLDGLVNIFGKCISCRGCRTACPVCYCEVCTFDLQAYDNRITTAELDRKWAVRVPPGTVYFQLTRLAHVGISCVGCGSCEDACPVGIPLGAIFKKVGEDVQKVFDYVPGKSLDEEIPLKTFETDEYTEVED